MSTLNATHVPHAAPGGVRHDIRHLEKRVTDLSDALAKLNSGDDLRRLLLILKRPGWTTPAEYIFAAGIIETMIEQARSLDQMKNELLKGSELVGGA